MANVSLIGSYIFLTSTKMKIKAVLSLDDFSQQTRHARSSFIQSSIITLLFTIKAWIISLKFVW